MQDQKNTLTKEEIAREKAKLKQIAASAQTQKQSGQRGWYVIPYLYRL
jgi:hypothetical protein